MVFLFFGKQKPLRANRGVFAEEYANENERNLKSVYHGGRACQAEVLSGGGVVLFIKTVLSVMAALFIFARRRGSVMLL